MPLPPPIPVRLVVESILEMAEVIRQEDGSTSLAGGLKYNILSRFKDPEKLLVLKLDLYLLVWAFIAGLTKVRTRISINLDGSENQYIIRTWINLQRLKPMCLG